MAQTSFDHDDGYLDQLINHCKKNLGKRRTVYTMRSESTNFEDFHNTDNSFIFRDSHNQFRDSFLSSDIRGDNWENKPKFGRKSFVDNSFDDGIRRREKLKKNRFNRKSLVEDLGKSILEEKDYYKILSLDPKFTTDLDVKKSFKNVRFFLVLITLVDSEISS